MTRILIVTIASLLASSIAARSAVSVRDRLAPRGGREHIQLADPVLAPFAHARHCVQYPDECRVRRMPFRGGKLALTEKRWAELTAVNAEVNRSIKPERNLQGVAGEEWQIAPKVGDCNDYAVTKRHELLARGWPSRALLLAEVILPSGEHHLVLVVRVKEGDFVLDNLNANIRPWNKTQYRWVRLQTPSNPAVWTGRRRHLAFADDDARRADAGGFCRGTAPRLPIRR
jgi:predicted transglutaminase-like cysteine proteinase